MACCSAVRFSISIPRVLSIDSAPFNIEKQNNKKKDQEVLPEGNTYPNLLPGVNEKCGD
jgi:hypothetical protein